jgi:hypothetical protein
MKNRIMTTVMLLVGAGTAFAAAGEEISGASLITKIFLGFFALIVATQLIPGLIMLGSLLKGLFGKEARSAKLGGGSRGGHSS